MEHKHQFTDLKGEVDLPNGVTLALSTIGAVVYIKDGKRTTLDGPDQVKSFWFDVSDTWPEPQRIPHDPNAAERARQAQAAIDARKARNFTVTKDADGNVVLTLDDGTTAKLPARV